MKHRSSSLNYPPDFRGEMIIIHSLTAENQGEVDFLKLLARSVPEHLSKKQSKLKVHIHGIDGLENDGKSLYFSQRIIKK